LRQFASDRLAVIVDAIVKHDLGTVLARISDFELWSILRETHNTHRVWRNQTMTMED
jgi:hypothetical protein